MKLNYLLRSLDLYKTHPFILFSQQKYISSLPSQFFSLLTLLFLFSQTIQLISQRLNFQDYKITDIDVQYDGEQQVEISGQEFMFAFSF